MLENLQQLIQTSMALESGAGSVFDFTEQQGPGSSCLSLSYQEHLILFGEFVDDIRTGYLSRTDARSILAQARAVVLDEQDLVSESCALDFAYAEKIVPQLARLCAGIVHIFQATHERSCCSYNCDFQPRHTRVSFRLDD